EVLHYQRLQQEPAVSVRIRPHSTITAGRKIRKFGDEFSIVIEQFLGLLAPHPVFQDFQVFRLLQVGYRYLVGAPSTFDRLAIHKFRSVHPLGLRRMIIGQNGRVVDPLERASFWMAWISSIIISRVAAMSWCIDSGSCPSTK